MAQHYSQPQRTYSPLPRSDSPHHAPPSNPYPPIKRQQLSPNSQTPPYNSPSINNIALPNQVFSSPYYNTQTNGNSGNHPYNPYQQQADAMSPASNQPHNYGGQANSPYSPNTHYNPYTTNNPPNNNTAYSTMNAPTPQPGPSGAMGPPSRPAVDKPTDINELGDVIAGTGIDLREEEAALVNYNKGGQQRQDGGYNANVTQSFNSLGAPPRDNYYSPNYPGDRSSFYGGGAFNQQPEPPKSTAELAAETRKKALRRKAEIKSYHLNNPFLAPKILLRLVGKLAQSNQVLVPTAGPGPNRWKPGDPPTRVEVLGPDKNVQVKMVTTGEYLHTDSPYVEILSLLSLATEERLRGLVEDAAALAKGRRMGSSGVVPIELSDLVTGNGASETVTGLPTPSNSAVSPTANPLKRSYADMNNPLTPNSDKSKPVKSIAFRSIVPKVLNAVAQTERKWEEERLAKRQRRLAAESSRAGSISLGTPGTPGEVAPEVETKKGARAKEQKDAAARKATEAQQHAATTKTMNMALGLSGAMGKKLSWMQKGTDTGPSNPFLPKANPNAGNSKSGPAATNGTSSGLPKSRIFGETSEDKTTGANIQIRDVISVLENDGKENKTLQRAYQRQGKAAPGK